MTELDAAILLIVKGVSLKESVSRLYKAGESGDQQLCDCVTRGLIDLTEYNEIIGE